MRPPDGGTCRANKNQRKSQFNNKRSTPHSHLLPLPPPHSRSHYRHFHPTKIGGVLTTSCRTWGRGEMYGPQSTSPIDRDTHRPPGQLRRGPGSSVWWEEGKGGREVRIKIQKRGEIRNPRFFVHPTMRSDQPIGDRRADNVHLASHCHLPSLSSSLSLPVHTLTSSMLSGQPSCPPSATTRFCLG